MIEFNYENDFILNNENNYFIWVEEIITSEFKTLGEINYIFCDDAYLLELNLKHLNHDNYTDIITFNYCEGDIISGDIFISTDRVKENAVTFNVTFENELLRVMAHGLLHLIGYDDKTIENIIIMRQKEDEKIKLFHVEQI